MICPQTKAKCKNLAFCDMTGKCLEHEADLLTPPPPTLADIERLVDDLAQAGKDYAMDYCDSKKIDAAHAALMAAIRLYVQE